MFQKLSKKLRKKQGFTLIELIVVLAILGIILAIAVPNYLGVQAKAQEQADTRAKDLAETSVRTWYSAENVSGDVDIDLPTGGGDPTWTSGEDSKRQAYEDSYMPQELTLNNYDFVTVTVTVSGSTVSFDSSLETN